MNPEDEGCLALLLVVLLLTIVVLIAERALSANAWRKEAVETGNARWVLNPTDGSSKWEWINHRPVPSQPTTVPTTSPQEARP